MALTCSNYEKLGSARSSHAPQVPWLLDHASLYILSATNSKAADCGCIGLKQQGPFPCHLRCRPRLVSTVGKQSAELRCADGASGHRVVDAARFYSGCVHASQSLSL